MKRKQKGEKNLEEKKISNFTCSFSKRIGKRNKSESMKESESDELKEKFSAHNRRRKKYCG